MIVNIWMNTIRLLSQPAYSGACDWQVAVLPLDYNTFLVRLKNTNEKKALAMKAKVDPWYRLAWYLGHMYKNPCESSFHSTIHLMWAIHLEVASGCKILCTYFYNLNIEAWWQREREIPGCQEPLRVMLIVYWVFGGVLGRVFFLCVGGCFVLRETGSTWPAAILF